jgi:hypothetical protein
VDAGNFYASSGIELEYDSSDPYLLLVNASEPVVFGATGGSGVEDRESGALAPFNLSLCALANRGEDGASGAAATTVTTVTNAGCAQHGGSVAPPPLATQLRLDLRGVGAGFPFFFVRVQAYRRARYPIQKVEQPSKHQWYVTVGRGVVHNSSVADAAVARDLAEGRLVHATGQSRRPLLVQQAASFGPATSPAVRQARRSLRVAQRMQASRYLWFRSH